MSRHPGAGRAPAGFSVVELLIVLLVAGLASAIALPRLLPERLAAEQGAQVLASTLMQAQRLAVTEQRNVIVSFSPDRAEARIHVDADHDGERGEGERSFVVPLGDGVQLGVGGATPGTGDSPPVTFPATEEGERAVTFHRNGSASDAGAVYVTARGARPEDARLVTLERSTGRAELLRPADGSWVSVRRP